MHVCVSMCVCESYKISATSIALKLGQDLRVLLYVTADRYIKRYKDSVSS